ncbi:MAG: TIM barrel protein [Acidobacteria bacterium]|nr:TIM barrel protein [Acidobacteriota bacterium]
MSDAFAPRPEHKFSFGLWTVGNRGRDPFGDAVRDPLPPEDAVALLGEVGAWGVNLHDNDLVPIDATPADRDRIVKGFQRACERHGVVVPMATVNLFFDPVFRDGAFTANDPRVRAYAVQKTMTAMDLGAELGARIFVLWGGREGTETDASRRPDEAIKHLRDAIDFLCEYSIDRKYGFRFAAWEAGKLFHIDLNDQAPGRYDQDFRFGSANVKAAFWLVKFLEDVGYGGPRHFDAHAYRTEDYAGVREFARGCMRTYLILRERAKQWNADREIQALVAALRDGEAPAFSSYSARHRDTLLSTAFDRPALAGRGLGYERLDQLTMEILLGVRT